MSHIQMIFGLVALASAVVLMLGSVSRVLAGLVLLGSALEILMALHLVSLGVAGVPVLAVLGGLIGVPGLILFFRVSSKNAIAASTAATLVGALQVLHALRLF